MPITLGVPERPATVREYQRWLQAERDLVVDERLEREYDRVTSALKEQLEASPFWTSLSNRLYEVDQGYYVRTHNHLLDHALPPPLQIKDFSSFLGKTLRKNVLNNVDWPSPPDGDWLLPPNWYGRINDTVRTSFVTEYIDAVPIVMDVVYGAAQAEGHTATSSMEATFEGYYAGHLDIRAPVEVVLDGMHAEFLDLAVELQVTTQLQHNIKGLLHRNYDRARFTKPDGLWMWKATTPEFRTNYLGHVLHYIEGMIVNERDAAPDS